jgi:chromate transporter
MSIGLQRAGYAGLFAAWLGFTLPSAVLLVAFAWGATELGATAGTGWIQGLKAAAVAVVANAVVGMARKLTPDGQRATIAVAAMILSMLSASAAGQIAAIVAGGLIGLAWLRPDPADGRDRETSTVPVGRKTGAVFLVLFAGLLFLLPLAVAVTGNPVLRMVDSFYRAGSLVFGGGHVVLPLLQAGVVEPGFVDRQTFLAGYGAAQAVPGPLFSFAAYLGVVFEMPPSGILGASVALVAIYLPSAFLIMGGLPFWDSLRKSPVARRALSGINAAVVGILAAAFYDPVFTNGVTSAMAMAVAAAAFVALAAWKVPAWAVVVAAGFAGFAFL